MTRLLLTGSSGFVGTNLYDAFRQDFDLYGLDITKVGKIPGDKVFGWDELDRLPEVDAIIHLAGKAHDTSNTTAEAEYFKINLGLTQRIFDHFLRSKAEKFIFFSSVKAVADSVEGMLTEQIIPAPKTSYGKSKLAAEQYIASKSIHEDKKVYILRPCMIHGPGNKGNLNLLYQVVKKGIPWPLGAFDNKRSFVSMVNLVFIIRELIGRDIQSGVYQIADDDPVATNELIKLIARSCGHKARIMKVPKKMIHLFARTGDLFLLPLNSERLNKLTENYVVSNKKIKQALDIITLPLNTMEGLENTLNHFGRNKRS